MSHKKMFKTLFKKKIFLIIIFSLIIRLVYSPTPYGWNEDIYVRGIREFYKDPLWILKLGEPDPLFQVGPVFYAFFVPFYYISKFLSVPDNFMLHVISSVLDSITIFIYYLLAKELFGKKVGLVSSLFLSVFPITWMVGRHVTSENVSFPFLMLSLLFFVRFLKNKDRTRLDISMFLFGISFLSRYDVILMLPIMLLFYTYETRSSLSKTTFYNILRMVLMFCLTISPFVIFSMIKFGVPIPSPHWVNILSTATSSFTSYDYRYSTSQLFSLVNLYICIFSLPFIPSILYSSNKISKKLSKNHIFFILALSLIILGFFRITGDILLRPSLSDFGFGDEAAQSLYFLFSLIGYITLISFSIVLCKGSFEERFLSFWTILFFLIWFSLMRDWQIQPRYLLIASLPIILLGSHFTLKLPKFSRKALITSAFLLFFIVGLVLNQWATSNWTVMYNIVVYLEEHTNESDLVLFSPTNGYYERVYFDPEPFVTVRPDWYHRWISYKTSIRYVVFDTSNYYLVNHEVREFLEQREDLLEETFYVDVILPFVSIRTDIINVYKTEGVVLPNAEEVEYFSDYFV